MARHGFIKANTLINEYIVRHDIPKREKAQNITINSKGIGKITKDGEKVNIVIKELFDILRQGEVQIEGSSENKDEVWISISNKSVEETINVFLSDYKLRNDIIKKIVEIAKKHNLNGVNINFNDIENSKDFERFIMELTPRLREMDVSTCVTINKSVNKGNIGNIVDYIIE